MICDKNKQTINKLYKLKIFGYKYIDEIGSNYKNNINLPNNLEHLNEMISDCNLCKLANLCDEKILSNKKYNKKILFVSTFFNTNDKSNNEFFKIISKKLDIKEKDINILNMLKCKVNLAIDDISNELSICKNYFIKEIDIIQPELIVSLGDTYKYLYNTTFKKGNIIKLGTNNLIVTEHLYAMLQNPSLKNNFIEDLEKIKKYLEIS
jgi:DNA polymerase